MTRRGSLVYYLGGIAVGCLFMAAYMSLLVNPGTRWSIRNFLGFYSSAVFLGGWTALLFAFLLRRLTAALGARRYWEWMIAGAALAPAVIWFLGDVVQFLVVLGQGPGWQAMPLLWIQVLMLMAPTAIVGTRLGMWGAIPVGAATAYVLSYIHRAFEPKLDSVQQ